MIFAIEYLLFGFLMYEQNTYKFYSLFDHYFFDHYGNDLSVSNGTETRK